MNNLAESVEIPRNTIEFTEVGRFLIEPYYCILGNGQFGEVNKAYDTKNKNKVVAVKKISKQKADEKYIKREIKALTQVEGSCFIKLVEVLQTESNFYIFMDYVPGVDLEKLGRKLNLLETLSMIKQIASGFLCQKKIVYHRDLKPANIIYVNGKFYVVDLGLMNFFEDQRSIEMNKSNFCGTPRYQSPQQKNGGDYTSKCDVWALGVIAYEYLVGDMPKDLKAVFPKEHDIVLRDLLQGMLQLEENHRFSWKDVYKHKALLDIYIEEDDFLEKIKKETNEKKFLF